MLPEVVVCSQSVNSLLSFQGFIIGWTSDFVPKLVYRFLYNPHDFTLRGYMINSLSKFNVSDFDAGQRPATSVPEFQNVTIC